LRMQINGATAGSYDTVVAAGNVALDGTLNILMNPEASNGTGTCYLSYPGYTPVIGDKFTIITAGSFSRPTDFNHNNSVEGGDFTQFNNNFGTGTGADADGDG